MTDPQCVPLTDPQCVPMTRTASVYPYFVETTPVSIEECVPLTLIVDRRVRRPRK